MAALLDKPELVAVAALLRQFRGGSSLSLRKPSFNEPTYSSKPITVNTILAVAPSTPDWQTALQYSAPKQFRAVVTGYIASTVEPPVTPGVEFRLCLNENPVQSTAIAPGVDVCTLAQAPWPRRPRATRVFLDENSVIQLQVRNIGPVPRTALLAFFGWAYDTINLEPGDSGSLGITDA